MIKKLLILGFILSVFIFSPNSAQGDLFTNDICSLKVETKAGYFFFTNKKMRDVYKNGGYEIQISGSYPLRGCLDLYGSIGFIDATGRSLNFNQKTDFWQIPVDLGLKQTINIASCIDWYAALGPRYFYAHQHNHSDYVNRNIGKSGLGLFVNTGFDYYLNCNFYIKLFGEYSYQQIKPSSSEIGVNNRNLQVGGFYFGAGLGYAF